MSQAGYTPISLYYSTTAAAVPTSGNLVAGELAINTLDGKLYYKNSAGTVTLLASSTTVTNSFSAGTTGLTPNTATTGAVTLAGTLITTNGGTGLASYTAGDLSYFVSGTALTKLAIGTAGQILTSSGTAPQWSTLSGVAVTTFSAGTTGFTPSSATSGAVTLAGTLATTNGGTGLSSFTSGGVVYASSSSALATGSALTFDGTTATTPRLAFGGTTLPAAGTATIFLRSSDNNLYLQSGSGNGINFLDGSQNTMLTLAPTTLSFNISNANALTLTSSLLNTASGVNVAFGDTTAGARLSVVKAITGGNIGTSFQQELVNNDSLVIGNWTGTVYRWLTGNANTNQAYIGAVLTNVNVDTLSDLVFGVKNSNAGNTIVEAMRIQTGNVGIGTSSPSAKLEVNGATSIFGGAGTAAGLTALTVGDATNATFRMAFTNGPLIQFAKNSTVAFAFGSKESSSGTFTEQMRLSAAGDVGIGTSSPSTKLDIKKDSATAYNPSTAAFNTILNISNTTSGASTNALMSFATELNGEWYIGGVQNSGNTAADFVFVSRASGARAERARIPSTGGLLVGATTTASSISNTAPLVGGRIYSFNGEETTLTTGTARTLFTLTADYATYIVSCSGIASNVIYSETAIVMINNTSVSVSIIADGTLCTISVSGLNVQYTQNSGATMGTVIYSATRIL